LQRALDVGLPALARNRAAVAADGRALRRCAGDRAAARGAATPGFPGAPRVTDNR